MLSSNRPAPKLMDFRRIGSRSPPNRTAPGSGTPEDGNVTERTVKRTTIEKAACCSWFKQAAPVAADCLAEQRRRVATLCVALECPRASGLKGEAQASPLSRLCARRSFSLTLQRSGPTTTVRRQRRKDEHAPRRRRKAEIQPATHTSRVPMSAVFSEDLPAGRPEVAQRVNARYRKKKKKKQRDQPERGQTATCASTSASANGGRRRKWAPARRLLFLL